MAANPLSIAMSISAKDNASPALRELQKNLGGVLTKTAALAASSVAFVKMAGAIRNSILPASQFNKELMRISLSAEGTTKRVKELYDSIYDNAQRTGIGRENLAAGYSRLTTEGLKVEDINSVMNAVSKTMLVTGATSEQLASNALMARRSFGINLDETGAQELFDKIHQASISGTAGFNDLSMILQKVGTSANRANIGLEETLALTQGLASSGESAEVVATMNKSMMRLFNDPKLRRTIERRAGVQFFDRETGERNSVIDIFGQIQNAYMSKETDRERSRLFDTVFDGVDARTKNALYSIISDGASVNNMRTMYESISKANGVVARDAEEFQRNYATQSAILAQTLRRARESAGKSVGDLLVAPLEMINKTLGTGDYGNVLLGTTAGMGLLAGGLALGGLGKIGKLAGGLGKAAVGSQVAEKLGVTSVFVTNMPPVMQGINKLPGALSKVSVGLNLAAAGALGWSIGTALNEHMKQNPDGFANRFTDSVIEDIMNLVSPRHREMRREERNEERRRNYASLRSFDNTEIYGTEEENRKLRESLEFSDDEFSFAKMPSIDNNISVSVFMDKNGRLIDQRVLEQREYSDRREFAVLDR